MKYTQIFIDQERIAGAALVTELGLRVVTWQIYEDGLGPDILGLIPGIRR